MTCTMTSMPSAAVRAELAPTGTLRVALNHSNFLLVGRDPASGAPRGVAPDLAQELGRRLDVPVRFVSYDAPSKIADAAQSDVWDVAFLGAEPARANVIDFTAAYLEIEATYLVPPGSRLRSIEEVDRPGVRISLYGRSAYDLYLTRTIRHAKLLRTDSIDSSWVQFLKDKLEALAGLRPRLVTDSEALPGSRILEGRFTAVQQAIGTPKRTGGGTPKGSGEGTSKGSGEGARYLREYAEEIKSSGLVAAAIERNGVRGVTVAAAAPL